MENFQITDQFPKFWVSGFCFNVNGNRILLLAIEEIEKWQPFLKYALYRKNSNYQPIQSLGL